MGIEVPTAARGSSDVALACDKPKPPTGPSNGSFGDVAPGRGARLIGRHANRPTAVQAMPPRPMAS